MGRTLKYVQRGGHSASYYTRRYGLITSWALDEASGTMLDSVGGNNLTATNNPLAGAAKVGAASRQFVAASSPYGSIADNAALSAGDIDFWVAAWALLDGGGGTAKTLVAKFNTSTPMREWQLSYNGTSSRFRFVVSPVANGTGETPVLANGFGAASNATWYYVMAYHDAVSNLLGISVNGGAFDTAAYSAGCFDGSAAFTIGGSAAPADYWDGRIDAVRFGKSPPLGIAALAPELRDYYYNGGNGR